MAKRVVKLGVDYDIMTMLYGELINEYGDGECIETFEICSEEGIGLSGSTIDRIAYERGGKDIMFFFNENTGDCDMLDEFKLKDLVSFFEEIYPILKSGKYNNDYYYDEFGNQGEINSARHDLS